MEKDNKEIIENAERKENNTEKKEQSDKKNGNRRKILWITLGIVLALCLGIFIFIRINMTETHVYEEVENLAEREGVCFDNLLLSCMIEIYNDDSGKTELKDLCIFNNGDVYCFEWPERYSWSLYYGGYDEAVWKKMYNAVYLGRLSNWDTIRLNQYVQDFDPEGDYYNIGDTYSLLEPDSKGESLQDQIQIEGVSIWTYYGVTLYWHKQPEKDSRKDIIIEAYEINYLGNNTYEKGELWFKSYEENAIAALELFEFSGFYDRWISLYIQDYKEILPGEADPRVEPESEMDNWNITYDLDLE